MHHCLYFSFFLSYSHINKLHILQDLDENQNEVKLEGEKREKVESRCNDLTPLPPTSDARINKIKGNITKNINYHYLNLLNKID